ncbi:DedA family protein [Celeribacter neptunius]|uniref:Membrane protein DedA, SNARE-associated domain n=1 Tax=Celeribacter neptunius TaxID=588602 RepID=A0A1I3LX80_9RHOB|nr:DedA family protein [Celeribacter neptunius]SFI89303.1 membrane protein DedA, SNARE-associated domain [Celeribacter neptunius]
MSESIFNAVTAYGVWGVVISAFLSCLLVPIPTSLMMLAAGALAAAGDLAPLPLIAGAFTGAVLGDQAGYALGRRAGPPVLAWLNRSATRRKVISRAEKMVDAHGGMGVFFSTWLFAPLGPYVNIVSGATRLSWLRFSLADIAGEAIWVNAYVWIGYAFAANIAEISQMMSDIIGILVAGAVGLAALSWAIAALRAQRALTVPAMSPAQSSSLTSETVKAQDALAE